MPMHRAALSAPSKNKVFELVLACVCMQAMQGMSQDCCKAALPRHQLNLAAQSHIHATACACKRACLPLRLLGRLQGDTGGRPHRRAWGPGTQVPVEHERGANQAALRHCLPWVTCPQCAHMNRRHSAIMKNSLPAPGKAASTDVICLRLVLGPNERTAGLMGELRVPEGPANSCTAKHMADAEACAGVHAEGGQLGLA